MSDPSPPPRFAAVALDLPVDRLFTYRVPEALRGQTDVGHRVLVPFRGRPRGGIVATLEADRPAFDVLDVADAPDAEPLLGAELLELGRFIARYYGCSLGEALAAMVPRGVRERSTRRSKRH